MRYLRIVGSPLKAKDVALTAINAVLYCTGSLATAYLPTGPFFIQFRPAIAIPAIFAVLFGPWIGGLGAALGTFLASIIRYGTPLLTIFGGTPANFAGFAILGYVASKLSRKTHWVIAVTVGTLVGMLVGSVIIGVGLHVLSVIFGLSQLRAFSDLGFALYASFILVFAPLPISLPLSLAIIKACYLAYPSLKKS